MIEQELQKQLTILVIFGAGAFMFLGALLGIIIKHFMDLPYILACKYSKKMEEKE